MGRIMMLMPVDNMQSLFPVNRLHIKYRVLGNHAAAELLKEVCMK